MDISADTIVAPATPDGFGGVSVIRLSGPNSIKIIKSISLLLNNKTPIYKPNCAVYVKILEKNGRTLDDGFITFFKAPKSYTGENSYEISCHGNPSLVKKIINRCCNEGARIASPGEFTRRAFLNGKIDLLQAEAVSNLIYSKSVKSASLNHKILRGGLSKKIREIREKLFGLLAKIEFELDFSEEELQENLRGSLLFEMEKITSQTKNLIKTYNDSRLLLVGANVAIVGKPNVGKSTLLNSLCGKNRAITSPTAGTTRDFIESPVVFDGTPLQLIDTAGLRSGASGPEKEGVKRTRKTAKNSDLVLFLYAVDKKNEIKSKHRRTGPAIHVVNKQDLLTNKTINKIKSKHPNFLFVSAKNNKGTRALKVKIKKTILSSPLPLSGEVLTTARQEKNMKEAHSFFIAANNLLNEKEPNYEVVSHELRSSLEKINLLLGGVGTKNEVLDLVFSSFCVGK